MIKDKLSQFLLVAIILAAFILPGCIDYTIETKINPDGSGKRVLIVAIDESFANMAGEGEEGDIEKQLKAGAPKDAKTKTYTKDGKVNYRIEFNFKDAKELEKTNKDMSKDKKEGQAPKTSNVKLEKKDWFVYATYEFSEEFPASKGAAEQLDQLTQGFTVDYKLTLPGKITKASTDNFKEGTATWNFSMNEGKKIEASSQLIRWTWIIIIGIVILGLILVLILILIFTRKSKKPKSQKKEDPEAQPEM